MVLTNLKMYIFYLPNFDLICFLNCRKLKAGNMKTAKKPIIKGTISPSSNMVSSDGTAMPVSTDVATPNFSEENPSSTEKVLPIYQDDGMIPMSTDKTILPSSEDAIISFTPDDKFPTLEPGNTDSLPSISPKDLIMPIIVVTGHNSYFITSYMDPVS